MEPKALTDWFFIILSPRILNYEENMEKARTFVRKLVREAAEKGDITIADISATPYVVRCAYTDRTTIERVFQKAVDVSKQRSHRKKLQMIMFCIPSENSDEMYRYIKYCGEMVYNVRTQCVRDDQVIQIPGDDYLANLLLKVSGKLAGRDSVITTRMAERSAHFAADR